MRYDREILEIPLPPRAAPEQQDLSSYPSAYLLRVVALRHLMGEESDSQGAHIGSRLGLSTDNSDENSQPPCDVSTYAATMQLAPVKSCFHRCLVSGLSIDLHCFSG
jgi:hypothetical protein